MNPDEIRALIRAREIEARALITQAKASGRLLTEEEQARFDGYRAEMEQAQATLSRYEAMEAMETQNRQPAREPMVPPVAVLDRPAAGEGVNLANFGFRNFGDYLVSVAHSSMPGYGIDGRLLKMQAAVSGASESIPSDGGYLVGTDMASELLASTHETGQLVGRVRHIPISANSNGIKFNGVDETSRANGSRWGGVQVYWDGEGDLFTASRPKFRQIELSLHKMTGLFYATDELIQDSAALESIARQAFSEEFGFKLDDAILNGSGAGMPTGIIGHASTVSVAKEAGQAAATVVYQNIIKMWAAMYARGRQNAVWLVNPDVEPILMSMSLAVGTGGIPVWMPAGGISGAPYSTLMGRPILPMEQCAALGTVGDICLVDPTQYVMIDKGGIQTASSIHVRFVYDEMTFRWVLRTDGQPTWKSTLAPYKGSTTTGPFVTLATRS